MNFLDDFPFPACMFILKVPQKTLHSLGLAVAWRSIRFFSIFNQLKYSITHDTLLAHRELVRERTFKTLQG